MRSDEAFRDRIMSRKDVDTRLAVARRAGYEFTQAEYKEVQSELSHRAMDTVTGGSHFTRNPFFFICCNILLCQ